MHSCISHAKWLGGLLKCTVCQKDLALRYRIGEEVRVYVHEKFKKLVQALEQREDAYKVSSWRDLLGDISFSDFDDLLRDFRRKPFDLFPVQEGGERDAEDSEGQHPIGFSSFDDVEIEQRLEKNRRDFKLLEKSILINT